MKEMSYVHVTTHQSQRNTWVYPGLNEVTNQTFSIKNIFSFTNNRDGVILDLHFILCIFFFHGVLCNIISILYLFDGHLIV